MIANILYLLGCACFAAGTIINMMAKS